MDCQIKNCGRFRKGTGWSVGEQIEQLWALIKVTTCSANIAIGKLLYNVYPSLAVLLPTQPAAGIVRYMTSQNRRDFIEFLLSDITRLKRLNIVSRTANFWRRMTKKRQLLQEDVGKLNQEASAAGE